MVSSTQQEIRANARRKRSAHFTSSCPSNIIFQQSLLMLVLQEHLRKSYSVLVMGLLNCLYPHMIQRQETISQSQCIVFAVIFFIWRQGKRYSIMISMLISNITLTFQVSSTQQYLKTLATLNMKRWMPLLQYLKTLNIVAVEQTDLNFKKPLRLMGPSRENQLITQLKFCRNWVLI